MSGWPSWSHATRTGVMVSLVALGCTGAIGEVGPRDPAPAEEDGTPAPGGSGGNAPSLPSEAAMPAAPAGPNVAVAAPVGTGEAGKAYPDLVPAPAPMQRLTTAQYDNSIADVFGTDVRRAAAIEPDETAETLVFRSVAAAVVSTSTRGVEQYRAAALDIAGQVMARRAQVPPLAICAPAKATDACVAAAVRALGLRLWRRPLSDEEVRRYTDLVGAEGPSSDDLQNGLRYAVATLVASPNFLYRPTLGEPDPASGRRRLTGWEMASRLSYFLWDSTPDPELLDAAATGALVTPDGIAAQVKRMLGRPRARVVAARYLAESWGVVRLDETSKSTKFFPQWSGALLHAYKQELAAVLDDLVFGGRADFRAVFDGRETFASKALAKVYGLPVTSADFVRTPLDERRSGLLTSGAVLSATSPSWRTSPTERGVFLRERLLCQEVPPPPPSVMAAGFQTEGGLPRNRTVRQALEDHRRDPPCSGCHGFFDPAGLLFESFDGIGAYRSTDNGLPIDTSGSLDGVSLGGVRELGATLAKGTQAARCIAEQLYTFALGHERGQGEEGAVTALQDGFEASGFDFQNLLGAVATNVGFRYVASPQ